MRIEDVIWLEDIVAKLEAKHDVTPHEVMETSRAVHCFASWRKAAGKARTSIWLLDGPTRGGISRSSSS